MSDVRDLEAMVTAAAIASEKQHSSEKRKSRARRQLEHAKEHRKNSSEGASKRKGSSPDLTDGFQKTKIMKPNDHNYNLSEGIPEDYESSTQVSMHVDQPPGVEYDDPSTQNLDMSSSFDDEAENRALDFNQQKWETIQELARDWMNAAGTDVSNFVVMKLSQGKLEWGGPACMARFVQDRGIVTRFLNAAKNQSTSPGEVKSSAPPRKKSSKCSLHDISIKDLSSTSMRHLVTNLCNKEHAIGFWKEKNKLPWWPDGVPFVSPNTVPIGSDARRLRVTDLVKVLEAYKKHRRQKMEKSLVPSSPESAPQSPLAKEEGEEEKEEMKKKGRGRDPWPVIVPVLCSPAQSTPETPTFGTPCASGSSATPASSQLPVRSTPSDIAFTVSPYSNPVTPALADAASTPNPLTSALADATAAKPSVSYLNSETSGLVLYETLIRKSLLKKSPKTTPPNLHHWRKIHDVAKLWVESAGEHVAPFVVMKYSSGRLEWGGPAFMGNFVRDKVVLAKYVNIASKRPTQTFVKKASVAPPKVNVKNTVLKTNTKDMSVTTMRNLITQICNVNNEKRFWSEVNRPSWWPAHIPFVSPNAMPFGKYDRGRLRVTELMAILDSYKHHEAEAGDGSTMEGMDHTTLSAPPPSSPKEQIVPSSNAPGKLEDMVATLKFKNKILQSNQRKWKILQELAREWVDNSGDTVSSFVIMRLTPGKLEWEGPAFMEDFVRDNGVLGKFVNTALNRPAISFIPSSSEKLY